MTATTLARGSAPDSPPPDRPGVLARLAGASLRARRTVLALWLVAVALLVGLGGRVAGDFQADYSATGSDSSAAVALLAERFPAQSGVVVDVVVRSHGPLEARRGAVDALLARLGTDPLVASTTSPWQAGGQVAGDGRTGLGGLRLTARTADAAPVADVRRLLATADATRVPGLQVALGGQAVSQAEQGAIGSEGIGLLAAALVLVLTFGTVVAAGLPILVAVLGLASSAALIGVLAQVLAVPDWSTSLAAMMGIGVGIDYVLLVLTRFREQLALGLDVPEAVARTYDTAGRSVLVAGGTVVVSLLGLAAMGLSYMTGAAVATMVAVTVVVLATMTLLPALLGFLGHRVDRLRVLPARTRRPGRVGAWSRWARTVQRRPLLAAAAGLAVLAVLAAPVTGLRFGFPDAGHDPAGTSSRTAYDLTAAAFGAGAAGPLVLVSDAGAAPLQRLATSLTGDRAVAALGTPSVAPDGRASVLTVVPSTSPEDPATARLVRHLRDVAPAGVHVGGATAAAIDSTDDVVGRLPLLVGGVVGLSFLLLLAVFRSPAVAVKAAVLNLLSIGAAYGVVALVLEGGWAGRLVGIDTATPLPAFVPVLMFAVLFGLSMDYEVFLMSRVREVWLRTGDASESVVAGLAGTGRVITAAAAIMVAVFAAFVPSDQVFLKVIGIGLATAILVDATVVRMLLVPAVLQLLGRRAWAVPAWLDRALPALHVEGRPVPVPA